MIVEPSVLITAIVLTFNIGAFVGFFSSRFVTHAQCRVRRDDIERQRAKIDEIVSDDRKAVWDKVDFLYERELARAK